MMTNSSVSVLRETREDEKRVVMLPCDAETFVRAGFKLLVAEGAGSGLGYADADYSHAGAKVVSQEVAWRDSNLVLKYKAPMPAEFEFFRPGLHLAAIFHAEGDTELTCSLCDNFVSAYSYEFFQDDDGEFPLAAPGAEIAGKLAIIYASYHLQLQQGGAGMLLPSTHGARKTRVLVIGHGKAGGAAARLAFQMGAEVRILGRSHARARKFAGSLSPDVLWGVSSPELVSEWGSWADVIVGAILISTFDTPTLVPSELLEKMRPGSIIIDVTCGYGPGYMPSFDRTTSLREPVYLRSGILHCKIDNLPAAVPQTTTEAFSAVAIPYLLELAELVTGRRRTAPAAERGLIVAGGQPVHPVLRDHMQRLAPELLK